jgi:Protein kinase domain/WD40-like Beta Propeller Repeat
VTLAVGARVGPYEILSSIGAGGMGEVYRARDTGLKREVALKVLQAAFVDDPDRLARFQREAELLASLNHPNIAAVYGLEKTNGVTAIVLELVEGDTLADVIARGPITLEDALPIALQITEALEAAHENGVLHRDLKPANIKVRGDGTVKVLDFGLAKAMEPSAGSSLSMSMSPTITTPAMTQAGMILGTAAYMSPEQAKGRTVDARADVWAFGVVLFEMVSGQRAFDGEDIADVLGAVVRLDPRWDVLPASVPPRVLQVLRRCLQKNVKARLAHIQDVRLALEGAFETAASQTSGTATQQAPAATRMLPWVVATALALLLLVTSGALWRSTRPVEQVLRPLVRLDVDLGADVSLGAAGDDTILSPDGARIVYVSQARLWTRRLDQPTATELPGTQGAYAPLFSPDGRWVAFFTHGSLRKISVEGGTAIVLSPAGFSRGGRWGEDDQIIAALGSAGGLSRIPSAGGPTTPVTELRSGEAAHRWPQVLAGGKAVLFTASATTAYDAANIDVLSVADHRRKTLVQGGTFGRYLPSGHLVYVNRGTLGWKCTGRLSQCSSKSATTPRTARRSSRSPTRAPCCTAAVEREADSSRWCGWTAREKRSRC